MQSMSTISVSGGILSMAFTRLFGSSIVVNFSERSALWAAIRCRIPSSKAMAVATKMRLLNLRAVSTA